MLGSRPSGARRGNGPSGIWSVRVKCKPTATRWAKGFKAGASLGQDGMQVMAPVADNRPAAANSRMPRLTAGEMP